MSMTTLVWQDLLEVSFVCFQGVGEVGGVGRGKLEPWTALGHVVSWPLGHHPLSASRVGSAGGTSRFCQVSGDHCTGWDQPGLMLSQEAQPTSEEEMGRVWIHLERGSGRA